ncbi:disulfide bond formation protein DsbB [Alteromonadaceae bacterium Bs31]|nr:disulfide bond formation protein DsbB [Alteromonadaceae bacterium Bs31]
MKTAFTALLNCGDKRWPYLTLLFICLALEGGAVLFQEVYNYYPCELCIYTRVWMTFIVLFCIVGLLVRNKLYLRRLGILALLILTSGLAHVVYRLIAIEYGFNADGACSLVANFPSWARLDEWMPTLFLVQDSCGVTPTIIFGITMAEGLVLAVAGFYLALITAFIGSLLNGKDTANLHDTQTTS